MRKLLSIYLLISCAVALAEEQITLSTIQLNNLGVQTGPLIAVKSIPLMNAPAKVSIPPANEYLVSTSHAGLVNRIYVSIGDEIEKGHVLAMIKSPELLALQQRHLKSVNNLRVAKTQYIRDGKLYKEGVIADRRWLETKVNYQVFKSQFNETRQLLEISGISQSDINALEKSHKMSSQLKVSTPISGVVLNRMITVGERVDALASLFRVANLEKLWLDISIPQQRIAQVHIGDTVILEGIETAAKIFLLGKSVNEENQTVLVRAEVKTGKHLVRPGQTVNVKIRQTSQHPIFKVPNTAIAQFKGKSYLFVRNKTGFAVTPVQVLGREEQKTIITGDIQEKNKIAIKGAVALKANFLGLGSDE